MKGISYPFLILLLLFSGWNWLQAQEANVTTGGDFTGSGGKVSFSIGQAFYTTISGVTGSAAQGVQQAYEISVVTGISPRKQNNLQISVYPNPASEYIILKMEGNNVARYPAMRVQLIGPDGRILADEKVLEKESKIRMADYVSGAYFLKVSDQNREVQTFKIIKF
jgi:hypothetical protein